MNKFRKLGLIEYNGKHRDPQFAAQRRPQRPPADQEESPVPLEVIFPPPRSGGGTIAREAMVEGAAAFFTNLNHRHRPRMRCDPSSATFAAHPHLPILITRCTEHAHGRRTSSLQAVLRLGRTGRRRLPRLRRAPGRPPHRQRPPETLRPRARSIPPTSSTPKTRPWTTHARWPICSKPRKDCGAKLYVGEARPRTYAPLDKQQTHYPECCAEHDHRHRRPAKGREHHEGSGGSCKSRRGSRTALVQIGL